MIRSLSSAAAQVPRDKLTAESQRQYAGRLFADVVVRIVAFCLDAVFILFCLAFLDDHLFQSFLITEQFRMAAWSLLLLIYFTVSWVSPLHATPMQWLFRMRVLHESGAPLSLRHVLIRSVALISLAGVVLFSLNNFEIVAYGDWGKALFILLLVFIPCITAWRQGLHDFAARSVVVNLRALCSEGAEQEMRDFLANNSPQVKRISRPPFYKIVVDGLVLSIPICLMTMAAEINHHKKIYARTVYAFEETKDLKAQVESYFKDTGNWPSAAEALGGPSRQNYPDGGFFQLEEGGVIRIQFEILPELKAGSFLLEPRFRDGDILWKCRVIGDIKRRYRFGDCRD